MQDNMLSDILVWLLLSNTAADKHILISVFIFARGTKCSGDASFLKHPTLLCVTSDVAVGKGRDLLWAVSNHGCIRTSFSPEETLTH